jgi:type II secretory pathway pseudopilin PulG
MKLIPSDQRESPRRESARSPRVCRRRNAAFTMVEIALCLGVIAFALVAIIGVLPTGLQVQKENNEDTVLNQDGMLLLEAIRSGSRGLDYLTNYFDLITVTNLRQQSASATVFTGPFLRGYARPSGVAFGGPLTNGQQIVGLLTLPKYVIDAADPRNLTVATNYVSARVRAITGSAIEKTKVLSSDADNTRDFAFAYELTAEAIPLRYAYPPQYYTNQSLSGPEGAMQTNLWNIVRNEEFNAYELRLTLQGPSLPRGGGFEVLGRPKVFRTIVSGMMATNSVIPNPGDIATFRPNTFRQWQP